MSELPLTWHCEVLSVYDLILSIVEVIIVLLCVAVEILQVGHHRHTPPGIPALRVGRDGHRELRRRVFLTHPAGSDRQRDTYMNKLTSAMLSNPFKLLFSSIEYFSFQISLSGEMLWIHRREE